MAKETPLQSKRSKESKGVNSPIQPASKQAGVDAHASTSSSESHSCCSARGAPLTKRPLLYRTQVPKPSWRNLTLVNLSGLGI